MTASPITTPFHLDGNYRPVTTELTESDLPVDGTIPEATQRPLPPQRTQPPTRRPVDALVLRRRHDPRRRALRRTRPLVSQPLGPHDHLHRRRDRCSAPTSASTARAGLANTNVIAHAGRTLALVETSFPYELTDQLDTIGPYDFDGRLTTAMTAHPKICPTTGELHFFGYALTPPYLTYHCADATGRLIQSTEIDVPGPTMMHDFAITATHVVFFDLPVVFDIERALAGTMPFRWDDTYGARIGLLPRNQPDAHVTWHEIEPCYVFHVLNAHEASWELSKPGFVVTIKTMTTLRITIRLPKPLPAPIACQRCGFDLDEAGSCAFCGALQKTEEVGIAQPWASEEEISAWKQAAWQSG